MPSFNLLWILITGSFVVWFVCLLFWDGLSPNSIFFFLISVGVLYTCELELGMKSMNWSKWEIWLLQRRDGMLWYFWYFYEHFVSLSFFIVTLRRYCYGDDSINRKKQQSCIQCLYQYLKYKDMRMPSLICCIWSFWLVIILTHAWRWTFQIQIVWFRLSIG